jgi:hypothetical protein
VVNENGNIEKEELRAAHKLVNDLKTLCKATAPVPAEVDRAIADRARRHFVRRRPRHVLRWAAPATAAAIIILVFTVDTSDKAGRAPLSKITDSQELFVNGVEEPGPVAPLGKAERESRLADHSGTAGRGVMEKGIAAMSTDGVLVAASADVDLNGRVDILDAFKLAKHIKAGIRPDTKWDINGDGAVNRSDVDAIARAAVRLDKGVL